MISRPSLRGKTLQRGLRNVSYLRTGRWMPSPSFTAFLKVLHHSLTTFQHYKMRGILSALEERVSPSTTQFSRTIFCFSPIPFSISAYVPSLHLTMQILVSTPSLVSCHHRGIPWLLSVSSAPRCPHHLSISRDLLP